MPSGVDAQKREFNKLSVMKSHHEQTTTTQLHSEKETHSLTAQYYFPVIHKTMA